MSEKEPDDPFDLSELPDLDDLDLSADSGGDLDLPGLSELEPLTEASAANPSELPELEELTPAPPSKPASAAPRDGLPVLPPEAKVVRPAGPRPAPSKTPSTRPRPAALAPKSKSKSKPDEGSAPELPAGVEKVPPAASRTQAKPQPKAPEKPAPKPIAKAPEKLAPKPVAKAPEKPEPKPVAKAPEKPEPKPVAKAPEKSASSPGPESEVPIPAAAEAGKPTAAIERVAAEGSPPAVPTGAVGTGGAQQDLAPLHLRKASWIVVFGSLVPWMGSGAGPVTLVGAKAGVCLGAWLLFQTVRQGAGEKVPGFVAKLAAIRWAMDSGKRKKGFLEQLSNTIPSAGHLIGLAVLLLGVFVTTLDPWLGEVTEGGDVGGGSLLKALAEVGMLAWAAGTMVHIFAYTHGGKFNPIFPLMFIGMVFAGLISLLRAFGEENTLLLASGVVGSLLVASGGVFACYTIFEAMRRAKVEGEAKKAAAREARRRARGTGSGGGRKGKVVGTPRTVRSPKADGKSVEASGADSAES